MKNSILFILSLLVSTHSFSSEFFVSPDGGSLTQCDGLSKTSLAESSNGHCAVNHIFELIHPGYQSDQPEMYKGGFKGGDIITLLNNADGSAAEYKMAHFDKYEHDKCDISWAYGCYIANIPAGTAENPTTIRGESWNEGCATPAKLYGSDRAQTIFSARDTEHIAFSCLEITDKSSCISAHGYSNSEVICDRGTPYDKPFADTGFSFSDVEHLSLTDIKVSGLSTGISAGRIGNATFKRVVLYANSTAGYNGDIVDGGEGDAITGPVSFIDSKIMFSGCGQIWDPSDPNTHGKPHSCASQDQGGYGDGLGTGKTGGDWLFDNVDIMYNGSDGLDMLYHRIDDGKTVTVRNSRIEGNAGNQLKISGNAIIENNLVVGNCAWIKNQPAALGAYGELCRAHGAAISVSALFEDQSIYMINNTVIAEGDCIMGASVSQSYGSTSNQSLFMVNNIFYGAIDAVSQYENACFNYTENPIPNQVIHNNIIHKTKTYDSPCDLFSVLLNDDIAEINNCVNAYGAEFDDRDFSVASNPQFTHALSLTKSDPSYLYQPEDSEDYGVNLQLLATSPAIDKGYNADMLGDYKLPTHDYNGNLRSNRSDIGAIEYNAVV
ncbi:MAG: hypothetical protein GY951_11065, partial [Psychromonas sp.]|nr:hypothetical protein [Psychromonas sp.]